MCLFFIEKELLSRSNGKRIKGLLLLYDLLFLFNVFFLGMNAVDNFTKYMKGRATKKQAKKVHEKLLT